jgi:hypothetical protein
VGTPTYIETENIVMMMATLRSLDRMLFESLATGGKEKK